MVIRILLADDHQMVLDGVERALAGEPGMVVVGQARDGASLLCLAEELEPEAVVMEAHLSGMSGVEAVRQLLDANPALKIVVLSIHENLNTALIMLREGAKGYVTKHSATSELVRALRLALHDQHHLSPDLFSRLVMEILSGRIVAGGRLHPKLTMREQEVLVLLAEGHNARHIAGQLKINPKTVDSHRNNIMKKLQIDSVAGLVKYALREGLVTL